LQQSGNKIRLIFNWPAGVTQVHIATANDFTQAKLFTLQEYKMFGGAVLDSPPGTTNYYIFPSCHDAGSYRPTGQAAHVQHINQSIIRFTLEEKIDQYKQHKLTIHPEGYIPAATVFYVKNNHPPASITDGIKYPLEAIRQPTTRIIRTNLDEYIRLFLGDGENLYKLEGQQNGTF